MNTEDLATNPVAEDGQVAPATPEAEAEEVEETEDEQPEEPELETDEDADNQAEPEPVEMIEIEREGVKYSIPKSLEGEFMMQRDYTQKTQEVSALKKNLEGIGQAHQQASEAEQLAMRDLNAIDARLAEYRQVDWRGLDTNTAIAARAEIDQLKDQREEVLGYYRQANQQRLSAEQRATETLREERHAELARSIPGWNDEHAKALIADAKSAYGFSEDEIASDMDVRAARVLQDALAYRKLQTKTKAASKADTAEKTKPASKVRGGASRPPSLARVAASSEDLDEWVKTRNEQLAKRK